MKKIFTTLLIVLSFCLIVPAVASAGAVINVGNRSMCKPIGEIVVNQYIYENKAPLNENQSVFMADSEFISGNGTVGYVSVRGLASNTGDQVVAVPISFDNNSGTTASTSHTFKVNVGTGSRTLTLNTPSQSTVTLVQSYVTRRTNMLPANMVDTLVATATSHSVSPSATGSRFGNDFGCFPGYGYGDYALSLVPLDKGFEQGIKNVYRVTKEAVVIPTTNCPINLDANPTSIQFGNNMTTSLSWYATNTGNCQQPTSCVGTWSSNLSIPSGNQSNVPVNVGAGQTQTYTINCNYANNGTSSDTATVTVGNQQQQNSNCPVTLDATPNLISPGGIVNLNWTATGSGCTPANYCFADDSYGWGNGQLNNQGNRTYQSPPSLTSGQLNFRIKCYYPDSSIRTADDSVSIQQQYVPPPPPPPPPCYNCAPVIIPPNPYQNPGNAGTSGIAGSPIVRTMAAGSIEKKSAKLRGYFNANGCPTINTYFEYGQDRTFLEFHSDGIIQANKYGNVEFVATNLKAATKYYFRIVGENCKGTSYGAIEWFRTASGSVPAYGGVVGGTTRNTTIRNTTVTNTTNTVVDTSIKAIGAGTSYLRLDITNDNDIPDETNSLLHTVIRGEVVVYRVVWENLTTSQLRDGKIRVNLPKALTFMNSSNGIYDKDSHSVYMTIGDIAGRASGVEFITVSVTTNGQVGDPVIVEAIAAFDAPGSDAQVNATDFDEDVLGDRSVAAAATPFFGNWMWIIGLLLLLILVFLIARYHTLASQYRNGGGNGGYRPQYQPMPVYTPPAAPMPTYVAVPEPERDPFVPPAVLVREEGMPVYKPFNPNN